jgi:hypothetical protein
LAFCQVLRSGSCSSTPGSSATHRISRYDACFRISTPQSWALPVGLGFVTEFSFHKTQYEENSGRVELRPILDSEFTRWQVVFNPVFDRAMHGPGTRHGWNSEPAGLLRWKPFSPSLEYYGEIPGINVAPRAQPEVHQMFVGG